MQANSQTNGPPTDTVNSQPAQELNDSAFSSSQLDEHTLSLENRQKVLQQISDRFSSLEALSQFNVEELKSLISKVLHEERFDVKCYEADRALKTLDVIMNFAEEAQEIDEYLEAYELSQKLYQVIYPEKEKILAYDPANDELGHNEQNLIDLIVYTDVLSFAI